MSKYTFIELALNDVKPNPFRSISDYELDEEKVDALAESITGTGFWANVVVRENANGDYEMAYGHHRLEAAKRVLGGDHIHQFPVADIPDHAMLQIMGNENSEDWGHTTKHTDLTVLAARSFLDDLLNQYPTWGEAILADGGLPPKAELIVWFAGDGNEFNAQGNYELSVKEGVGRKVIAKFLGWGSDMRVKLSLDHLGPSVKRAKANKYALAKAESDKKDAEIALEKKKETTATTPSEKKLKKESVARGEQQLAKAKKKKAVAEKKQGGGGYDVKAGQVFKSQSHSKMFKSQVTSVGLANLIPKKDQVRVANAIVEIGKKEGQEVTAKYIRSVLGRMNRANTIAINAEIVKKDPMALYIDLVKKATNTLESSAKAVDALALQFAKDGITTDGVTLYDLKSHVPQLIEALVKLYALDGEMPPMMKAEDHTNPATGRKHTKYSVGEAA